MAPRVLGVMGRESRRGESAIAGEMLKYLTAMRPSTETAVYPGAHGLKFGQRKRRTMKKTEENKE